MSYDEDKDVFDNEREEREQEEEKHPHFKPDDPAYWEQEESEWDHLKPRTRIPFWVWLLCGLAVVGLVVGCWIRYFSPYVEDATQYGYVEGIEKRRCIEWMANRNRKPINTKMIWKLFINSTV